MMTIGDDGEALRERETGEALGGNYGVIYSRPSGPLTFPPVNLRGARKDCLGAQPPVGPTGSNPSNRIGGMVWAKADYLASRPTIVQLVPSKSTVSPTWTVR